MQREENDNGDTNCGMEEEGPAEEESGRGRRRRRRKKKMRRKMNLWFQTGDLLVSYFVLLLSDCS